MAKAVSESNLNRPMGLAESATQWLGEPTVQPTEEEQDQLTERMTRITRVLERNRLMDYRMADIADAYTQVPFNNSSGENETSSIESHETDTIESMPSLEPREEEEDKDESVSTCNSQNEVFPLYLPEDEDNDPDVPIPIVDEAIEDEAVIAQEDITNQDHEAHHRVSTCRTPIQCQCLKAMKKSTQEPGLWFPSQEPSRTL